MIRDLVGEVVELRLQYGGSFELDVLFVSYLNQ